MKHWEEIQIGEFNGPLDLLLTMIRDKKMSINDVNLVELADQYVSYIESQKSLDIEIASEFLAMAAQLIEMKSIFLLPKNIDEIFEEENVYEDFLEQLSRYEQIRNVTDFFLQKQGEYLQTFSKPKSKVKFSAKISEPNFSKTEALIETTNFDLEEFAQIFKRVMMNSEMRNYDLIEDFEPDFNTITTDVISPQEISQLILSRMKSDKLKVWRLEELIPLNLKSLKNLISTFLAVLDIVRYQVVKIQQEDETLLVEFTTMALENEAMIDNVEVHWNEE